ncbi:MAG TPA: ribonuclease H [Nostocaceae cyanobacterium]|nr:ribonuclease H [Nostocaceae cyanobacterium]
MSAFTSEILNNSNSDSSSNSDSNSKPKKLTRVIIHCDGACSGNGQLNSSGGWAAIIKSPDYPNHAPKIVCGCEAGTTNNRMEMTAAIEALKVLKYVCDVEIISDSQYLVNTMTKGWKRSKNIDLWQQLDDLLASSQHQVTWTWKKRNSTPELEECDRLAKLESEKV